MQRFEMDDASLQQGLAYALGYAVFVLTLNLRRSVGLAAAGPGSGRTSDSFAWPAERSWRHL